MSAGRFRGLVAALAALTLVVEVVPAAGKPRLPKRPPGRPAAPLSLKMCFADKCGPSVRVAAQSIANQMPTSVKGVGTVTAQLSSGKRVLTCPGPCSADFARGTRLTIRAEARQPEPAEQYDVKAIEGKGCVLVHQKYPRPELRICRITLTRPVTVTVTFGSV